MIAPSHIKPKLVVGSDARLSSPELKEALVRGLLESGADVHDVGFISTPTFYLVVARYGYDGGIQISASHNPKNWNGFKVVKGGAAPIGFEGGLSKVLEAIRQDLLPGASPLAGTLTEAYNLPSQALEELKVERALGAKNIKPFRIVFDGGNGMGGLDMKALFAHLPCKLVWMNEQPDGTFPAHPPDPLVIENTRDLSARVLKEKADLGLASDGDGDRYFFFDETGEVVPPEIVRGLIAQIELEKNPGATIVYDVRPGKITRDLIEEAGGKPVLAPVGHSLIKEKMIAENAVFGGESSGHFFYRLPYGTFEVPLMLVHSFLVFISAEDKPLSEVVAPYKRYFNSGENNVRLESREQGLFIIESLKKKYADGKQTALDGLTVEYPTFTFNVRLSNTEPLIRLIVESADKAIMETRRDELKALMVD